MRRAIFVFLMAATAATPLASVSAARPDREDRQQARAERQEQRSERREQRVERRVERPAQVRQQSYAPARQSPSPQTFARPERVQRVERPQIAQARNWQDRRGDRVRSDRPNRTIAPVRNVQQTRQWSGNNGNNQWDRNRGGGSNGNWDRNRSGNWNGDRNTSRSGNWNGSRSHSQNWNRNWRNDHRYDWQNYRDSNRGRYHLPHYYSPYRGWGYQRFSIGLFLEPLFYSNNYWIGDPGYYRLPPAYPGTRWVRYYDDVLLVDLYTGEVVDVIYGFFW